MATVTKFEELAIWKMSRELENEVFIHTQLPNFKRDFSLVDQINRSSGSTMDNIAEGFGRGSNKEFINFLIISRGSVTEVQSQLYRALDRKYLTQEQFEKSYQKANQIIASIVNFINYLNTKRNIDFRKGKDNPEK